MKQNKMGNLYFAKWEICTLRNGKSVLCKMGKSVLCEMGKSDEWTTTKQACQDESVAYLFLSSTNIYIYLYIYTVYNNKEICCCIVYFTVNFLLLSSLL